MISIPVSPAQMSRRPLTSLSNNVPSPYSSNNSMKRPGQKREDIYSQPPPAKRQFLDADFQKSRDLKQKLTASNLAIPKRESKTPSKQSTGSEFRHHAPAGPSGKLKLKMARVEPPPVFALDKVASQRMNGLKISANSRHAINGSKTPATTTTQGAPAEDNLRQWQRHYRKAFRHMVFYFDAVPEAVRDSMIDYLDHFGSTVDTFFSVKITHVVTSRDVPPENSKISDDKSAHPKTINPSLLEKFTAAQDRKRMNGRDGNRLTFDDLRGVSRNKDVLMMAREYEMKIWTMDKLERMLMTLMEDEDEPMAPAKKKSTTVQARDEKKEKAGLDQILRNEKINGPTDRDPTAMSKEMVYFKGPYLLVRDITKVHRPIMAREYPKVAFKEDGEWPQFRATSRGKCPFVEDPRDRSERLEEREREHQKKVAKESENIFGAFANPVVKAATGRMGPPPAKKIGAAKEISHIFEIATENPILHAEHKTQKDGKDTSTAAKANSGHKLFQATKAGAALINATTTDNAFPPQQQQQYQDRHGHHHQRDIKNYEPIASGMQSSITSAICSNAISSNPAGPTAARAGTSKDMYGLQRKILEKKSVNVSQNGITAPRTFAAAQKNVALTVAEEKKAQVAHLEKYMSANPTLEVPAELTAPAVKKVIAPGYCENCRVKFEDFDVHVISKRHRKFAMDNRNFDELDELLKQLKRPTKFEDDYE